MAIKAPSWCPNAVPHITKGWIDPDTGEVLASSRFTFAQIDEFFGVLAPEPEPSPVVEEVETDLPTDELDSLTKVQLEELGREHGVELDRRKTKSTLIQTMRGILSK